MLRHFGWPAIVILEMLEARGDGRRKAGATRPHCTHDVRAAVLFMVGSS